MEKVKIIISELIQNVNQLNNEKLVDVCSLYFKNFLFVDDDIVKEILIHEGNKVILKELNILSKSNGKYTFFNLLFLILFMSLI